MTSSLPFPPRPPRSAALALWLGATWLLNGIGPALLRRRLAQGKEDPARWREKLGEPTQARPPACPPDAPPARLVWLHAVSVGEGLSVLPLVRALIEARRDLTVLLTSTTTTAAGLLAGRVAALGQGRVILQYLPLDLPGPMGRFLSHWRPDVAVMVESEFWPRLIHDCHARGIPLILANARLSDRSVARWKRVPGLSRAMLGRFSALVAPDAAMANRLADIGAPPDRIAILGTLKRAADPLPFDRDEAGRLRAAIAGRPVWCAASTHPGEEAILARAHVALRRHLPDALMILAPRHPARAPEIAALLDEAGLRHDRRSRGEVPGAMVHMADTLGEMGLWFDLCPVTFMAGSLVPGIGGHNAYEPAAQGSAILHGPHVGNFPDLYARLDMAGGAACLADPEEIAARLALLLRDGAAAAAMAQAARSVVEGEGDGVSATARLILAQLEDR